MSSSPSFVELAKAVINTEADAVREMLEHIDDAFVRSCNLILNTQGRLVVIGMGKSGHIGNKIAATMASTGTPAFFVHPGEASHGDLGMITGEDVILALSYSGATDEVINLMPVIKRKGIPLIAMTGNPKSKLATNATVHINVKVSHEACPLGLAPTSSTTATLAMGDALAVALMASRGFTADDFALSHPGGSLGRKLLLFIDDLMHCGDDFPAVTPDTLISDAIIEMTSKRLGMTAVVENGKLLGIFTDGDLRRSFEKQINLHQTKISDVMITNCKTLSPGTLAAEAVQMMEQHSITVLIVVDNENRPVGALHMHDLLKAGVD
jgi:arabinose-5-phosphate isomerase